MLLSNGSSSSVSLSKPSELKYTFGLGRISWSATYHHKGRRDANQWNLLWFHFHCLKEPLLMIGYFLRMCERLEFFYLEIFCLRTIALSRWWLINSAWAVSLSCDYLLRPACKKNLTVCQAQEKVDVLVDSAGRQETWLGGPRRKKHD